MRISHITSMSISDWIQQQRFAHSTLLHMYIFIFWNQNLIWTFSIFFLFLIHFIHHIHSRKKRREANQREMRRWSEEWKTKSGDWNEMKRNTRQQQQSEWKAMKICAPIKELQYWKSEKRRVDEMNFLFERFALLRFFFIHSMRWRREWWRAQEELWERYFNSRRWISRREQHLTVQRERERENFCLFFNCCSLLHSRFCFDRGDES